MSSALSTGKGDRVGKKRRQKGRGKRERWETGLNAGLLNESSERRGGGPAASLIVTQTPSQPWEHARIPRSLHLSMLPSKWRNTATVHSIIHIRWRLITPTILLQSRETSDTDIHVDVTSTRTTRTSAVLLSMHDSIYDKSYSELRQALAAGHHTSSTET